MNKNNEIYNSSLKKKNVSHNTAIMKEHASTNGLSTLQVHRGVQTESHKESHKDSMKMDNASTNGLSPCGNSILQVHGCVQKEHVMVAINPSYPHDFINEEVVKRLQVPSKHILSTQVDGETMEISKYLKVSMGNYVLHSDFHARDMDNVDLVLGYPWIYSVGIVNLNVEKKFLHLWYKKNKTTLQYISLTKQEYPKGEHEQCL